MHYASETTSRRLHRFHGGLHLPDNKALSTGLAVAKAALPAQLIIPLQQHIGEMAHPVVAVGDRVRKGEMIAQPQGYVSASVHASSSGRVTAIEMRPVPHPSGLSALCVVIETDGLDEWGELPEPIEDIRGTDPSVLRERIRNAGIVGLGGAAFPSSVKLNPGREHPIETLVINGAECEPYITCDDMLMRDQADRIFRGITILRHLVGARDCLVGIEDNKPEAIAEMTAALARSGQRGIEVVTIPTLYPSGGEKQLIRVLTGLEVPSGTIPAHIGIICHNVGTAAAVADAVLEGRPLISRYVTVTGQGIAGPRNFDTLVGTPARDLISQAGGYTDAVTKLILGGPMMGFTLPDDTVPLTKAANCLLAVSADESPDPGAALPCIRCGRCADVCPVSLLPQQMYWYARARDLEKTQSYNLFDCIECGCCSHVCPSHIPLVQYYRFAKTESWASEREKQKAEHARQRHEARVARKERQEAERKARLQQKKAALAKNPAENPGAAADKKKAAIEAAMKRAAAKKAQQEQGGIAPKNTTDLTDAQQQAVARAEARRAETTAGADRAADERQE